MSTSTPTNSPTLTGATDLLGMRLIHRVMRHDAARLAQVADRALHHPAEFDDTRFAAIADYLTMYVSSVNHHHEVEDESLFPLIKDTAGPHVDMSELTEDHHALVALLDSLEGYAGEMRARKNEAGGQPPEHARRGLAQTLAELRDLLDEHIAEEEAQLFPIITAHVPARRWQKFEAAARRGGRMDFDLTRMAAAIRPEEQGQARATLPLPARILVAILAPRQRRRERAVFGG